MTTAFFLRLQQTRLIRQFHLFVECVKAADMFVCDMDTTLFICIYGTCDVKVRRLDKVCECIAYDSFECYLKRYR